MKNTLLVIAILVVAGIYIFVANKSYDMNPEYTPSASNTQTENTYTPETNPNTPTTPTTKTPVQTNVTVNIKNFSFIPSTLTIKTGTRVTWTNQDNVPHTVTSSSGNLLNSPMLSPGESFSFTFNSPVSESYYCIVHPRMIGRINVTN